MIRTINEMIRDEKLQMIFVRIEHAFIFQQLKMIRSFGDCIFNGKVTLVELDKKQSSLLNKILEFRVSQDQSIKQVRRKRKILLMTV